MEKEDCEDLCVAVEKVPRGCPTESLARLIKERSDSTVEKATEVLGAENDARFERLLFKLKSKDGKAFLLFSDFSNYTLGDVIYYFCDVVLL